MNEMTAAPETGTIIEQVIAKGDLSKLTADQRNTYYNEVCKSLGLNPLTQPFAYIQLQGKLVLYARRDCCDQLRKLRNVSVEIVSQRQEDELLTVHVRASDEAGRSDEDFEVVAFPSTLKGEARANAIMRAVTKGKRRVTLSICGLGLFDETEIDDVPRRPKPPGPNVITYAGDDATTEIDQPADSIESPDDAPAAVTTGDTPAAAGAANPDEVQSEALRETDRALTKAASLGTAELRRVWLALPKDRREVFAAALEGRFKPEAVRADAARPKDQHT